jgi:hypothetical protein
VQLANSRVVVTTKVPAVPAKDDHPLIFLLLSSFCHQS